MALVRNVLQATNTVIGAGFKAADSVVEAAGNATIKIAKGTGKLGKKAINTFTEEASEEALKEAGFAGSLIKKRLNKKGFIAVTAGTMAVATGNAIVNDGGMEKFNRLGNISTADNLDRLVSIDSSGYFDAVNQVSSGDPEVMQDMVKGTFNELNQFGASGDIVFALHNRREG